VFHANGSDDSFKDWVPSFLLGRLEQQLAHKGLDLHDVAVLAAALEDLIRGEATELVKGIFHELEVFRLSSNVSAQDALQLYTMSFLSNHRWDARIAVRSQKRFEDEYTDWNRSRTWLEGIEREHGLVNGNETGGVEMAAKVAINIGERYGSFNDKQCIELKSALLGMWSKGKTTGRVRLADFYRMGLDTQWDLVEKREYLGALGALDESNASNPLVIIANYLTARPNCLDATNLYATCCRNECEDFLGSLERSIAAPSATPQRIVELVRLLGSNSVQGPREVDTSLVDRLEEIAAQHGGQVKLHGRLFAQWMHHVFPNECPYPHEAGSSDPSSPDQWIGEDVAASEEDRRQFVEAESCTAEQAASEWTVEVPWSATEELVASHSDEKKGTSAFVLALELLPVLGALVLGLSSSREARQNFIAQVRARMHYQLAQLRMGIHRQHLLLAGLCLLLVVTNMVNVHLLVVMVCVGLLARHLVGMELPCIDGAAKDDKCMV